MTRNGRNGSTPFRGTVKTRRLINAVAFFMYYVYILYSQKCQRYYIGYSENVYLRLERHNGGLVKATKNCRPYILKAFKTFETELEARQEEIRLKKAKSAKYISWLIQNNW